MYLFQQQLLQYMSLQRTLKNIFEQIPCLIRQSKFLRIKEPNNEFKIKCFHNAVYKNNCTLLLLYELQ